MSLAHYTLSPLPKITLPSVHPSIHPVSLRGPRCLPVCVVHSPLFGLPPPSSGSSEAWTSSPLINAHQKWEIETTKEKRNTVITGHSPPPQNSPGGHLQSPFLFLNQTQLTLSDSVPLQPLLKEEKDNTKKCVCACVEVCV